MVIIYSSYFVYSVSFFFFIYLGSDCSVYIHVFSDRKSWINCLNVSFSSFFFLLLLNFAFALCSTNCLKSQPEISRDKFFCIRRCRQMRCHAVEEKTKICNRGQSMERNSHKIGEVLMSTIFFQFTYCRATRNLIHIFVF